MDRVCIIVEAPPQPMGSFFAIMPKGAKFPRVVRSGDAKIRKWQKAVKGAAQKACKSFNYAVFGREVPLDVRIEFRVPRPKYLAKKLDALPINAPDGDKLLRATLDALEGVCFEKDSQIVEYRVSKRYELPGYETPGSGPGASIIVTRFHHSAHALDPDQIPADAAQAPLSK